MHWMRIIPIMDQNCTGDGWPPYQYYKPGVLRASLFWISFEYCPHEDTLLPTSFNWWNLARRKFVSMQNGSERMHGNIREPESSSVSNSCESRTSIVKQHGEPRVILSHFCSLPNFVNLKSVHISRIECWDPVSVSWVGRSRSENSRAASRWSDLSWAADYVSEKQRPQGFPQGFPTGCQSSLVPPLVPQSSNDISQAPIGLSSCAPNIRLPDPNSVLLLRWVHRWQSIASSL